MRTAGDVQSQLDHLPGAVGVEDDSRLERAQRELRQPLAHRQRARARNLAVANGDRRLHRLSLSSPGLGRARDDVLQMALGRFG